MWVKNTCTHFRILWDTRHKSTLTALYPSAFVHLTNEESCFCPLSALIRGFAFAHDWLLAESLPFSMTCSTKELAFTPVSLLLSDSGYYLASLPLSTTDSTQKHCPLLTTQKLPLSTTDSTQKLPLSTTDYPRVYFCPLLTLPKSCLLSTTDSTQEFAFVHHWFYPRVCLCPLLTLPKICFCPLLTLPKRCLCPPLILPKSLPCPLLTLFKICFCPLLLLTKTLPLSTTDSTQELPLSTIDSIQNLLLSTTNSTQEFVFVYYWLYSKAAFVHFWFYPRVCLHPLLTLSKNCFCTLPILPKSLPLSTADAYPWVYLCLLLAFTKELASVHSLLLPESIVFSATCFFTWGSASDVVQPVCGRQCLRHTSCCQRLCLARPCPKHLSDAASPCPTAQNSRC